MTFFLIGLGSILMQNVSLFFFWPLLSIGWLVFRNEETVKIYWWSFLLGILVDLMVGRTLGLSVVFLLFFSMVAMILKTKFRINLLVLVVTLALFELIYYLLIRNFAF